MATGTIKDQYARFVSEDLVADNITISAGGTSDNVDKNVSKTGYTFIGIVGYSIEAASSGGANQGNCTLYRIMKVNDSTARVAAKNWGNSQAKIRIRMIVLYQKN